MAGERHYAFEILLLEIVMSLTVTSLEMEPMEMPCPPEQVLPVNVMFEPLLIARKSS